MNKTKYTVRVEPGALESAKRYAKAHQTTVTNLVEAFFHSLGDVGEAHSDTPILNELAGSLRTSTPLEDYQQYLEEKYLGTGGDNR